MRNHGKLCLDNPEKLLFTADPHFFHEGIIGHCGRPFPNAQAMNEVLIRNWNAAASAQGTVIVLGDMFWKGADMEKFARVMARLNGNKYLVAGNHDTMSREEYLKLGFQDAWDYLELRVRGRLVVCSHYPLLEWNGFYKDSWHLHGHSHGRGSHFSFRVLDVGVDAHNFTPIFWKQIERELDGGLELDMEAMRKRGAATRHAPYLFNG